MSTSKPLTRSGPGLYEFLIEAELQQYYNSLKSELKVASVAQLKYVTEADMAQIGMSKPEMRRLTKYFHKHCPQTVLGKMKKKLLAAHSREAPINVQHYPSTDTEAGGDTHLRTGLGQSGIGSTSSASLGGGGYGGGVRHASMAPAGRHIIPADAIVVHKKLGSGEFGTVQQGVWTTSETGERIQVAIKCLTQERMENNPIDFLKEAAIMHSVEHESIVRLYGVVLDTAALMLVTELAPLRSLLEFIKEPSMRSNASVPTLFDFAVQIADGMEYLESKRLIHRDLAARNILVFSKCKVKISDFGLSRALGIGKDYYQTNFNVNLKLPIAWCAPECINFLRFTSASDVWAYGVVLWELFSYGFQPWAGMTGQQILEAIDEPLYQRLERPECCPNEIYYQIMFKCWSHEPAARPTFQQLARALLQDCKPEQVQAIREFKAHASRGFGVAGISKSLPRGREQMLEYEAGEIITVLEKNPLQLQSPSPAGENSQNDPQPPPHQLVWKGVLKCGKSGLFHPTNTVTYIGPTPSLPSIGKGVGSSGTVSGGASLFKRGGSLRRSRLSADMISEPKGDLVHTGHVGVNGQVFGDVAFIGGSKCWLPKQVVTPYKPEPPSQSQQQMQQRAQAPLPPPGPGSAPPTPNEPLDGSDTAPLINHPTGSSSNKNSNSNSTQGSAPLPPASSSSTRRRPPPLALFNINTPAPPPPASSEEPHSDPDHEYHEISDEENENTNILDSRQRQRSAPGGITNPAEESQSPLDTPNTVITSFDPASPSPFDIDVDADLPPSTSSISASTGALAGAGRSLVDEVFGALERGREEPKGRGKESKDKHRSSSSSKKFGTVKPISASDRKTLEHAIALANELASKSMIDLASKKRSSDNLSFPPTPNSPLGAGGAAGASGGAGGTHGGGSSTGGKFSFILGGGRQHSRERIQRNYSQEAASIPDIQSSLTEEAKEAYNLLVQKTPTTPPTKSAGMSGSKSMNVFRFPDIDPPKKAQSQEEPTNYTQVYLKPDPAPPQPPPAAVDDEPDQNPLRMLRGMNKAGNVLPLPPRDRKKISASSRSFDESMSAIARPRVRHHRKYELVLPDLEQGKLPFEAAAQASATSEPPIVKKRPVAPPKPQRRISSGSESASSLSTTFSPPGSASHQRQSSQISQASSTGTGVSLDSSNYMNFEEESEFASTADMSLPKSDSTQSLGQSKTDEAKTQPAPHNLNEIDDPFCTPAKVRIVKRILGASTSDEDAKWALRLTTGDGARAVKVLRLKGLLPDSYFEAQTGTTKAISVLTDVHWDVARAAEFLLKVPSTPPRKLSFSSADIENANAISGDEPSYIRPTQV